MGHDLTLDGNYPAASKLNLITDWALYLSGQSLHSVVELVIFYHKYAPYFEIHIKMLRKLIKDYFRKTILLMAWSPVLIENFHGIKVCITSSPVLVRFDPNRFTFLKTGWSVEGMGYISMQPSNNSVSAEAAKILQIGGPCQFDKSKSGERLQPVNFGSRCCIGFF